MIEQDKKEIEKIVEEKIKDMFVTFLNLSIKDIFVAFSNLTKDAKKTKKRKFSKKKVKEIDEALENGYTVEKTKNRLKIYKIDDKFCILIDKLYSEVKFYLYKSKKFYDLKEEANKRRMRDFLKNNYKTGKLPDDNVDRDEINTKKYKINDECYIMFSGDNFYVYDERYEYRVFELSGENIEKVEEYLDKTYYRFGFKNKKTIDEEIREVEKDILEDVKKINKKFKKKLK